MGEDAAGPAGTGGDPTPEECRTAFAYLCAAGVATIRWSTARDPGEAEAHIAAFHLDGTGGEPLGLYALCRGFSLLHRHGEECAR